MKIEEVRKKTDKELQKLLAETRNELREVRFKVVSRQFKNHKQLGKLKKDISRILTIIKERQILKNINRTEK